MTAKALADSRAATTRRRQVRFPWWRAAACGGALLWLLPAPPGAAAARKASRKAGTQEAAATPAGGEKVATPDSAAGAAKPAAAGKSAGAAKSMTGAKPSGDAKMTMPGGQEGAAFGSLTVEGEDKIHIEFERPALDLHLDPRQAQGLELGSARQILDREPVDLTTPMLQASARERSPYLARAWLDELSSGPVARFRPAVDGVERWKLIVADSRGQSVMEYAGQGKPPKEIAWDGKTAAGQPALPGLTYSYVFEAFDRAGNKRNFVGEGFKVPAYRRTTANQLAMLFPGEGLQAAAARTATPPPAPVVLEAASWINQVPRLDHPVRVKATARSFELASALSQTLVQQLGSLVIGDPARIQGLTDVQPDAPAQGTVAITVGP